MTQRLKPIDNDPYDRPHDNWQTVEISNPDQTGTAGLMRTSSLRFNRKKFTFAITAFIVGTLAILMLSDTRNEFIAPGPLASNHAQLLVGHGADRCAACHEAGNRTFGEWLTSAFRPGNNAQACQSQLCMKCHANSISTEFATNPHNVSPEAMREISGLYVGNGLKLLHPPVSSQGEIECSACHREHHGKEDLTKMTVAQCQSCHQEQYQGFEIDHPEFHQWPQQKRQGIAFDHVSHGYKHFPGQNEEFDCQACHVDDRLQNVKLLANYETACAKCHQQDIEGRSESGLTLVSLPMLDLDSIKDNGLDVGAWPENASGDFDGKIPELARILLFADSKARAVFNKHGGDFDFADLDSENEQDVTDAVQLAWSIKYLLHDLAVGGEPEVQRRLQFALDRSLPQDQIEQLTSGLNAIMFARAVNQWLPELATEVPQRRETHSDQPIAQLISSQKPLRYVLDQLAADELARNPLGKLLGTAANGQNHPQAAAVQQQSPFPSSIPDVELDFENNVSLNEQSPPQLTVENNPEPVATSNVSTIQNNVPQIPEAELLAKNPLAQMANQPIANQATTQLPAAGQPVRQPNVSPSANQAQQPALTNRNPAPQIALPQIDESELLARNRLAELMASESMRNQAAAPVAPDAPAQANPSANIAQQNAPTNVHRDPASDQQIVEEFVEQVAEAQEQPRPAGFQLDQGADSERFVGSAVQGGWFRNDQLFQISYRPSGHSDRLLTVLSEVVATTPEAESHPAIGACFKKMTSNGSVGACNECHTTDQQHDKSFQINWQPKYRDPLRRSFTKFSHAPHTIQTELSDCTSCHTLDPNNSNANSFTSFNAENSSSNFSPITKLNCIRCHQEGGAGNQCTECHNYHIGSPASLSGNPTTTKLKN